MHAAKRNAHWVVAGVGLLSLGLSAGLSLQHVLAPLSAQDGNRPQAVLEAPADVGDIQNLGSTFRTVAKRVMPGVVSIETLGKRAVVQDNTEELFGENSPFPEFFKQNPELKEYFRRGTPRQAPRTRGQGSGFVIDPSGIILTNNHVVDGADEVRVRLENGQEYLATDIKTDPRTDVAVIRVKPEQPLTAVPLGDSDQMEIGDWVLAVGNPFGLETTVTAGIVSAKGRGMNITDREDFLQTDAAINPGNSGGPLVDLAGRVVGINTAIASRSGGADGVGFAVPINMVKWVSTQLLEKGNVTRAYLGIAMQDLTAEFARPLNLAVRGGVLVTEVKPGSPAADAKLETGDVVVKAGGKDIHSPRALQAIVEQMKIGETYDMVVVRNGKQMTLTVAAKEMPQDYALRANGRAFKQEPREEKGERSESKSLGLEVAKFTEDMAKALQFDTNGVVITRIDANSPAERAGLETGMAIEKVNNTQVTTPEEFAAAVKDIDPDRGVVLLVRTERGTQFVALKPGK